MSTDSLLKLAAIQPKQELSGTVKRIELAGAILDVHAEVDALLHISQIQPGRIKNVDDVLQEGKDVVVWVKNVDPERGTLSVTMIKPPAVDWREIAVGQMFRGNVVRIEKFGVFIDIGAERPGLVHISEMAADYVTSPSDVVQQGAEVEVRVIGLNKKKNQIDLSMKPLEPVATVSVVEEDPDEEEAPTAMALAYQRAMDTSAVATSTAKASTKESSTKKDSKKQDDLLSRTLERLENS